MTIDGIHIEHVTTWFHDHVPGIVGPLQFDLIAGGHSNLTYTVTDQTRNRWVLRRPPLFQVLQSAHDMEREHRIIKALAASDVPVPGLIGYCDDEAVNDRPFYVMHFVRGEVLRTAENAAAFGAQRLETVSRSLVDTLAAIHEVDVDAIGLGELGRKDDYVGRQLKRWLRQYHASQTSERPLFTEVHDHLVSCIPDQGRAGLVHGDYRLDNCLIDTDGSVAAVLDWELCTLGDVRTDVAQLLTYWTRPGDTFSPIEVAPTLAAGFPERSQVLEWYEESTGTAIADIDYYLSFCSWRLAAILEGVYSRYANGAMGDSQPQGGAEAFVWRIDALVAQAAAYAEKVA